MLAPTTRRGWAAAATIVVLAIAALPTRVLGDSLEDFFSLGQDGPFAGGLYAGHVSGTVVEGEIRDLVLTGHGQSVVYDREQTPDFQSFIDANADTIIEILFPSGLEGSAEGVPGASARSLEAFDRLLDFGTIAAAGRPRPGPDGRIEVAARNQTQALFEYERYRVDREDGNMFKLTPGYDYRFDHLEIGFAVPLRFSELEDELDTEAYTAGLDLHAKYDVYLYPEWTLVPMLGAGSNIFGVNADNTAGAGYVRYGGYAGLATIYEWASFIVGGGFMYSISDVALPDGLIPHDLEPIAHALSSRPADQQIMFGFKAAYELPYRMLASVGARHLVTIGSSDLDLSKQTLDQFAGSLMYAPTDNVALELGYKYLTAVSGLYSSSVYLQGALYF